MFKLKVEPSDFLIKKIDKEKLYTFLRDMEFNRLLSSVISTYGEIDFNEKNIKKENTEKKILILENIN